jgi:L-amino acid N-acyltransferase YncA
MTEIQIRLANPDDAEGMAAVLNPIIAAGGTTAHETPVTSDDMVEIIASAICCHVALDDAGEIAGMQWLDRLERLPADCGDIATFARLEPKRPGVGRALFSATCAAARAQGLTQLNAVIRADNVPGLGYYAKMGFRDHDVRPAVPLRDGTPVDRIVKRFAL